MHNIIRQEHFRRGIWIVGAFAIAITALILTVLFFIYKVFNDMNWYENSLYAVCFFAAMAAPFMKIDEYKTFKKHFISNTGYLIDWKSKDGNLLVITRAGIMVQFAHQAKKRTSKKFKGVKWGGENVKDALESFAHGGLSPMALLPAARFVETTNRVPNCIDFSSGDKLKLAYFDMDATRVLSIDLDKPGDKLKLHFNFPVARDTSFNEQDFDTFITMLGDKATFSVEHIYFDQQKYDAVTAN